MISSLSFKDADGYAVFTNQAHLFATRFAGWVVNRKPIGPSAVGLGTGQTFVFEFREEKTASFSIVGIPEAEMEKMVRLQYHLLSGHVVALAGDRSMSADFALCTLAPGTEPAISQTNAGLREYTMSVVVQPASEDDIPASEQYFPPSALVLPQTGALVLTGYAPTLANLRISPAKGELVLTGHAPTLANTTVSPAAGQVIVTGYAPMI